MHDIRQLFGPQAKGGFYLKNPWPLWPRTDRADFEKFIRFKQVLSGHEWLTFFNKFSLIVWLIYLICFVLILKPRPFHEVKGDRNHG